MQTIQTMESGERFRLTFEPMRREDRPQDKGRDGTGLSFRTSEHHGFDVCPETIVLSDAEGRRAFFDTDAEFSESSQRPQDEDMDGHTLRFDVVEYGGEYPDDMPQVIRVTDVPGRSCLYRPLRAEGLIVSAEGFTAAEPIGSEAS